MGSECYREFPLSNLRGFCTQRECRFPPISSFVLLVGIKNGSPQFGHANADQGHRTEEDGFPSDHECETLAGIWYMLFRLQGTPTPQNGQRVVCE